MCPLKMRFWDASREDESDVDERTVDEHSNDGLGGKFNNTQKFVWHAYRCLKAGWGLPPCVPNITVGIRPVVHAQNGEVLHDVCIS